MKNILDIQNDLKNTSDEHLVNLMQMPEPNFPQYLVLSEMDRRKEMRESYEAQQNVAQQQPTVAQELTMDTAQSGMQQGLGGLPTGSLRGAELQSRVTDMPVIYGNQPVQSMAGSVGMANGGRTGYQNAGQVNPQDLDPETQNKIVEFVKENPWATALNTAALIALVTPAPGGRVAAGVLGGLGKAVQFAPKMLGGLGLSGAKKSILEGLGSLGSKFKFPFDYGTRTSIPSTEAGKQYLKSFNLPWRLGAAVPLAATGYAFTGDDETVTTQPQTSDPYTPYMPPSDTIVEEKEEVVDTQEAGRKEDINTALVSLARIASAKPNELGNILASAGKDVATARRERKRDKLAEELTGAQAKYYKARAESAGFDKYKEAEALYVSAHIAFDKLSIPQQSALSPTGKIDSAEAKEAARQRYIMERLASGNLLEAWQEYQSVVGGGVGGLAEVEQAAKYVN